MRTGELHRRTEKYRRQVEDTRRELEVELRSDLPLVVTSEVERLRKAEHNALRLLIVAELYAGMIEDPDATVSWMGECLEAGEIVTRIPVEDDW